MLQASKHGSGNTFWSMAQRNAGVQQQAELHWLSCEWLLAGLGGGRRGAPAVCRDRPHGARQHQARAAGAQGVVLTVGCAYIWLCILVCPPVLGCNHDACQPGAGSSWAKPGTGSDGLNHGYLPHCICSHSLHVSTTAVANHAIANHAGDAAAPHRAAPLLWQYRYRAGGLSSVAAPCKQRPRPAALLE